MRLSRITKRGMVIAVICAAVFVGTAATAHAAVTIYYVLEQYVAPGHGGGDNTLYYRNFNDSCVYEDPPTQHWTKSIYADGNGNWLVSYEDYNGCWSGQAHLGPSSNYGYTYVEAKCDNPADENTQTFRMNCWTTEPS